MIKQRTRGTNLFDSLSRKMLVRKFVTNYEITSLINGKSVTDNFCFFLGVTVGV